MADVLLTPAKDCDYKWIGTKALLYICQLKRYGGSKPNPTEEFRTVRFEDGVVKLWVTRKDREKMEIGVLFSR